MTTAELLLAMGLGNLIEHLTPGEASEIVQVETISHGYRNIKEVFFLPDRTVIRLSEIPLI